MNTIEKIERLGALINKHEDFTKEQIDEMKKLLENLTKEELMKGAEKPSPPKPPIRPRVRVNGEYWTKAYGGEPERYTDRRDDCDDYNHATGNYFLTKEACQAYCTETNAKEIALQKIKDYIAENFGEFVPDWREIDQLKYYLDYRYYNTAQWATEYVVSHHPISIPFYFAEKSHAEECIRDCEEELNTLIGLK